GIKPFVAIYSTFIQRALDQIIHDIALQKLPVVFCLDRAGLVGEDGATHHGVFDLSMMQMIPNMTVIAPYCLEEMEKAMEWAAEFTEGPVVIRYPRGCAESDPDYAGFEYGKSNLIQKGEKLTLIGVGSGLLIAKKAAQMIKDQLGVNISVISMSFVKPLDMGLILDLIKEKQPIITIEENALNGGVGEHLSMLLNPYQIKVYPFAIPDEFITHGATSILKNKIKLCPESVLELIKEKKIL
ncbi:MAG TPA: transketolase C-terminal domain-containing protein, partial [Candidatus Cloacimonadota bacterium]|nr:transketolase C-terminal domain-containing protein [Candidatus Cloacimonadota bacterium]